MSISKKKCCVPGCMESGSHPTLHSFPNPAKDKSRFNQWVLAIGGDIIGLDNEDIYKHRSVCHIHFAEKFRCRFNRLSNIAVPTLNLPAPTSLPKFTIQERRPLIQTDNFSMPAPSTSGYSVPSTPAVNTREARNDRANKENTEPTPLLQFTYQERKPSRQAEMPTSSSGSFVPLAPVPASNSTNSQNDLTVKGKDTDKKEVKYTVTKRTKKHVKVTLAEQKLYKKLVQARIKLSKCRSNIKKQSASLKAAKRLLSNPALSATMEKLPKTAKVLTMMQFREVKKKIKGRRFSLQEKILALSMLKQAPKGYRFLRKILILPAPQTLTKVISKADIKPGINKKIFGQLKTVAEKMKTQEKLCVVMFDEMSLKASLSYNERKDEISGFVTDGQDTKSDYADHAQVYMIRGLVKNYKQPVSYTFSAAATSGPQIAKQLKQVITELQETGLIVVATVCDQGANNRSAIKQLLEETRGIYLRNGKEPKENVILINEHEVIPLYDPPHMMKCIRNNLLTKNLEYTSKGKTCTAKWQHLLLLHKENPGYKGVRLLPKLTQNHVVPEMVMKNKMKVKFATQVFSRTVATSMGYLADKGILPKDSRETADILLMFDDLFDSQNGSYDKKEKKFSKPLLGPVTPISAHHKKWTEVKEKLKSMKFVNPNTGKAENVPTLNNWVWTLDGTQVLLKKLEREYNITSVWMRHLNQDPLENFFGAIRSHGCRNINPTPEKFEGAFATLLINNMSSVHAPTGANCEQDYCQSLHALIVTDDCKATMTCDFDKMADIIIEDIEEKKKDPRIMAPLQYVSGYFIKNVKNNVFKSCQQCARDIMATDGIEYIKYREYASRQWLCSPTNAVVECISAIQDISNKVLKEFLSQKNIKEFLKTHVLMCVDFDFINCNEHKDDIIKYLINITARFFIYNYCKEINKILTGKIEHFDEDDRNHTKAKKFYKKCYKRKMK